MERNERFEVASPEFDLPEAGLEFWEWYWDISEGLTRIINGEPLRIPASEYEAWAKMTGNILTPDHFRVFRRMDQAYIEAMRIEIDYSRDLARQQAEQDAKGQKRYGR